MFLGMLRTGARGKGCAPVHSAQSQSAYSHFAHSLRVFCAVLLCAAAICGTALCGASLYGCGNNADERPALSVWVYSDEYKKQIEQAFGRDLTAVSWRLDITVLSAEELDSRMQTARANGTLPDIYMLSPDNLKMYAQSGTAEDISSLGISLSPARYYEYATDAGRDSDGTLRAVCWQPDPGMFFYRRSIAKAYLGTDSPDEIGAMLSDWQGFLDTARTLHEQSHGRTYMTAGIEDIMRAWLGSDTEGWVSDGRLNINDTALSFLDYAGTLAGEDLVYDTRQWSASWTAGISDPQSVFGYFSSGLGMKNVLKKACGGTVAGEGSYGDWACVEGPSPYNWGGCWLAVEPSSRMKKQAAVLLGYMLCEEEAMQRNCLIDGAFSSSRTVVEAIKYDSQFSDPFLSFQNYYSVQAGIANDITMARLSVYTSVIDSAFADCAYAYAFEGQPREDAIADFAKRVQTAYPELA